MVKRTPAAETRVSGDRRSNFDRFVEWAHLRASQAPLFVVCVGVLALWLVSFPLWSDLKEWQAVIHTVASVVTLLLIVLLENASRRASEAMQEKLNVLAEALAALMTSSSADDPELRTAVETLRDAVGLEQRH